MTASVPTMSELRELLPSLTAPERAELDRLIRPARPTPWTPLPGPQTAAFDSPAEEVYFGGRAGSGKTDLEIGLACTRHRRSVIFRREYKQLRAVIERAREVIGGRGRFNANDGV